MGKNVQITMAYYKDKTVVEVPEENLIDVLRPQEIYPCADLEACLNEQLDHSVNAEPFDLAVKGKKNICILVCDLTRPMETHRILPILLARIETNCPGARVTILVALGTHRPLSDEELDIVCGKGIRERYSVVNHAFDDPNALVRVETNETDIPVYVNKLLLEADFRIGVGAVKPHPIFGWSGGVKIVIPGVAGTETTGVSHWMSCPYKGVEIMGKVDSPVRACFEKIVQDANLLDYIVSAVLTEDSKVSDLRCGHIIDAHRACVEIARKYYVINEKEAADAVLVGVGKWGPDLWVGSNGVYQSEFYIKKGGTIVLFGNFPEGISPVHTEIAEWGYGPYRKVRKLVDDGTLSDDLTLAAHLVHLGRVLDARQAECVLISEGISREEAEKVGFRYLDKVDGVMEYLKRKHGDNVRVLAIPGFNSTPIISDYPAE